MDTIHAGDLEVHVWPGTRAEAPVAIAAHGITGNGLSWARTAELLDGEVTLVAPDLRGRAGSRDAPGPYGIGRHADDLVAVLDHLAVSEAVFVGHSMGGFVAAVSAVRHPSRTTGVVLVDGGLAFPARADLEPDAALQAFLGPALARLEMTFPSRDSYREFWQAHPAFKGEWTPWIEDYIQHDLVGSGPFRSSCVAAVVRIDGAQVLTDAMVQAAIHALPVPGVLLYAERGLLDEPPALYDSARVAGLHVRTRLVPDTNHYSILLADRGAEVVADHVRRRSERSHERAGI